MLIRRNGDEDWRSPAVTSYSDEAALQALLAGAPHLLPAGSLPLRMVREFPVASGSIDLVGVDAEGEITVCECKLEANRESRRMVVGQLFAYAGALWEMDASDFSGRFASRAGASLADVMAEPLAAAGRDQADFRERLQANLAEGRLRLIVAVDSITDELRATLRYLNEHTGPGVQVLALELRYVADDDVEMVFPRSFGEELAARAARPPAWDEDALLRALERDCTPVGSQAAQRLWRFLSKRAVRLSWGRGRHPGATVYLLVDGEEQPVMSLYAGGREWAANYSLNFEWMAARGVATERLDRLAAAIRKLPEAAGRLRGLEAAEFRRRPGLPIDGVLSAPDALETLEQALLELTAEADRSRP